MRLYNLNGKFVNRNITPYLINWDGPSRSKIQFAVKQFLKPYWKSYICLEECPVFGTRLRVDIINLSRRIALEVDGPQHSEFNKFFHQNRANYHKSIKRDFLKEEWLKKNNFSIINIETSDIPLLSVEFILKKFNISI